MGPPSYMRSVVDRNVVMRRVSVLLPHTLTFSKRTSYERFYILLTVHHVMILGKWPTWRAIFSMYLFIFLTLHVLSTSCSSSGETNCVNTTSGSCHSASVTVSCAGRKWVPFRPAYDTEWQLPEVVLTQIFSPDDEHDVLETCRQFKMKINA